MYVGVCVCIALSRGLGFRPLMSEIVLRHKVSEPTFYHSQLVYCNSFGVHPGLVHLFLFLGSGLETTKAVLFFRCFPPCMLY